MTELKLSFLFYLINSYAAYLLKEFFPGVLSWGDESDEIDFMLIY